MASDSNNKECLSKDSIQDVSEKDTESNDQAKPPQDVQDKQEGADKSLENHDVENNNSTENNNILKSTNELVHSETAITTPANSIESQTSQCQSHLKQDSELEKIHLACMKLIEKESDCQEDLKDQSSDSILQLLVTEDLSSIKSTLVLRAFFVEYLHQLPPKIISEILSVLIAIVKKSVFHLESSRGLLFSCMNYLLSNSVKCPSNQDQTKTESISTNSSLSLTKHFLREWINLLIAHSCGVEELKSILKLSESDPSLISFMQLANLKQRNRPHAFFAFPGTKGSMISLPPFQKWPIQIGWSFSTWFFLEPKACAQPYLYNFKTGKNGLGYSAHFTGNCLVLTSIRVKGKGVQHCVAYEFPSYKWIHCAITYHNKWRASEIKVYVNGQLSANIEMPWQVQTTEMFDKCFIGGSGSITNADRSGDLHCFCGQMSAIYLFNEGLSPAQICAIHRLGPSYMGQFKYSNESHVNLPPLVCKTLYEEKLASALFCLFTPVAVDSGALCIQLAPFKSSTSTSAQNYFVSAPHAALLGRTKAITTQPICATLQSLGSSRSLLPLLEVCARRRDAEACALLIGFLCDLLESSPHWFANEIVQNNGFVIVACILSSNSRALLSEKLLDIFLNLTKTLLTTSCTAGDQMLLKHLMDNILFNPSLWIYADTKLQTKLYNYLSTEFLYGTRHSMNKYSVGNSTNSYVAYSPTISAASAIYNQNVNYQANVTSSSDDQTKFSTSESHSASTTDLLFGEVRRVSTVLQSLHALKYYYWMSEELGINQKARNQKLRPNQNELKVIRMHILNFTKELIARADAVPLDEVQGLLNYLSTCTKTENLLDVMNIVLEMIKEHPAQMVQALDQKQGIKVVFALIGSRSENVRLKALRLLSRFLSHCTHKKKQEIMGPNNLFMLLCEHLRPFQPMTPELYRGLIDLMIEEEDETGVESPLDISKKRIENSMVIKVIASLIHDERISKRTKMEKTRLINNSSSEVANQDIRKMFINDMWNLIVNSRDNRRIILQMSVWQHWLINLVDSIVDDSQLIRDQILAIFRVLLYHAIRYEYGGWRVWIDTLAIIHAKVSFDEFHQQFSGEFKVSEPVHEDVSLEKNHQSTIEKGRKHDDKTPNHKVSSDLDTCGCADDNKSTVVSSISERIPNEHQGINMSERKDENDKQDENEDVTERSDEKGDEVDAKKNIVNEEDCESPVLEEQSASIDLVDLAPSRAFRKINLDDSEQPSTSPNDDDDAETSNDVTRQHSMTSIPLDEPSNNLEKEEIADSDEPHPDTVSEEVVDKYAHDDNEPQSLHSQRATTTPAFRVPEFKWSNLLLKLLNDLMFSIECDLYYWRCSAHFNSLDTPPFTPKTSSLGTNHTNAAPSGVLNSKNMTTISNQFDTILQRPEHQIYIINIIHFVSQLADNIIIASGGLLPLLADATGGAKSSTNETKSTQICEGLTIGQANSLLYRLVNMVDVVVFAAAHINLTELEADKNTTSGGILRQCLRLACTVTVKNCLVLRSLNNKIAEMGIGGEFNITANEFPKEMFESYHGCSLLSANGLFQESALTLDNTDLMANIEYSPHQTPNTTAMPSLLPFQTTPIRDPNKLLQALDICRIQACIYADQNPESRQSQFLALSSLYFISVLMVSKYRDIIEPKHKPSRIRTSSHASDSPAPSVRSDSSPVAGEPQNGVPLSSVEANLLSFGKMQPNNPEKSTSITTNALTHMLTTKLENTLDTVCPLLKSIMCDFSAFLSKTLIGSHGQDLVNKEAERTFKRANTSPVELVMLLCSQEWQNTLQKNAGLAFIELINEGRVLSHGMKDHIVRVAMEAEFILSRLRADDVTRHEHFNLACSESLSARMHEEVLINSLISSAARRDHVSYNKFKETVINERIRNYKLDIWEDDDRRKRRFVFDSWNDAQQKFYVINDGNSNNVSSTNSEKTDTKRILELQQTIELGGINDSNKSNSRHDESAGQPIDEQEDCEEEDYDDEDDERQHSDESNSPDTDNDHRASNQNDRAHSETSGEEKLSRGHNLYSSSSNKSTSKSEPNDTNHEAKGVQNWDYEDYGSVNEFTGSVVFAAECSLIWSIYAIPGIFQITTHELHFEPNQNVAEAIDSLKREKVNEQDDDENCLRSIRSDSTAEQISLRKIDLKALRYCDFLACNGKIVLSDIRAIFSRHYLLQPCALEIFLSQRTSVMFAFNDFDTVKRAVKYLPPVGVGIKYGIPQIRRASLMSPRQLFAASNMTQKWQKREIGNFQYLIFLNTIAGRTYQDLNQYPVFPWILTNYESEELDLNMPTNFRDLTKPVGALNNKRREEFIERYQTWDNPKVPAFHYGTHYSTATFTLNWLSRLRGSYNSSYLAIQDGKYEDESRLFLSIGDSWVSSLVGGQQNVKELIPEFFYLPEMFHADLGLPEVEFPPWAKSAEQFVRIHRMALESELVSCQLHQWIDLIFGYKQRGPEAINAINTFYYLTYQGSVNLGLIQDATLREAIETQIKHFGQTPSQLTTEPHPPRFSALHVSPLMFTSNHDDVNMTVKFPFNNPVIHISSCINNYIAVSASAADGSSTGTIQPSNGTNSPSSILTITSNNQYQIHKWMPNDQSGHPFVIDPQLEQASGNNSLRRHLIDVDDICSGIALKLYSHLEPKPILDEVQWPSSQYVVTLNGRYVIMGSFYDNSFRVFTTESGKLCQVIYGHRGPITCIARSEGNAAADFYLATGGQDCSLLIWIWNERYAQVEGSGISAVHNPLPKLSITGHHTPVLSAMICAELGLIVSGSKNLILVHTTTSAENLLVIDVNMPDLLKKTLCTSKLEHSSESHPIQRPHVQDKQRTILEASMLGDGSQSRKLSKETTEKSQSSSRSVSPTNKTINHFSQLLDLCCSDYYITSVQFARELGYIVCVALPPPKKKSKTVDEISAKSSAALLLTFNLKGCLMDSTPIGHAGSGPRLGDVCVSQTSRDGEYIIVNDSPITLKIYKTFGLQPVYAYNTNDVPDALNEDQNRIRSLALLDHRYILVGLENGKIIVYNTDFKSLH